MADVGCHHYQLCLLLSRGTAGKEKTDGRDADDTQNHGLHLDDQYGTRADRENSLKGGLNAMEREVENKIAVVAGGAKGIGKYICEEFEKIEWILESLQ